MSIRSCVCLAKVKFTSSYEAYDPIALLSYALDCVCYSRVFFFPHLIYHMICLHVIVDRCCTSFARGFHVLNKLGYGALSILQKTRLSNVVDR